MNNATVSKPTEAACTRCGGQFHLTYGDWNCLQCGHPPSAGKEAARCHECGEKVAQDHALCSACAAALCKPRAREKADTTPKKPLSAPKVRQVRHVQAQKTSQANNPTPDAGNRPSDAGDMEYATFPTVSQPRKRRSKTRQGKRLETMRIR